MMKSKSIELSDYDDLQEGIAEINHAICRTRGGGFKVYVPHEHRYWEYASALEVARGRKIDLAVDIGCGFSALGPALCYQQPLATVVECDPSPAVREDRSNIESGMNLNLLSDGSALMDLSDTYDAVFSISVMEHIPQADQQAAWDKLISLVAPGGLLFVTVDYSEQIIFGTEGERETYYNPTMLKAIINTLVDAGFSIEWDLTYHGSFVKDYTFFRIIAERP